MPELPEVETVVRGLQPQLTQKTIHNVIVRCDKLRWPIPSNLKQLLKQQRVKDISRRGKYLLLHLDAGTLIIHLGMSGRLCLLTKPQPIKAHDHVDIVFSDQLILRYTDPRRFGAMVWTNQAPHQHFLLEKLGPEPLESLFTAGYLYQKTRVRRAAIKIIIMNHHVVVGVGNIYATEALFLAGIHPATPANQLALEHYQLLVKIIKQVLRKAITQGGTTLKDFVNSAGERGYFSQQLNVYGQEGLRCVKCSSIIQSILLGQRSSAFCPSCQQEQAL
jgi:formamidopyrimidine-DNA glycosylase